MWLLLRGKSESELVSCFRWIVVSATQNPSDGFDSRLTGSIGGLLGGTCTHTEVLASRTLHKCYDLVISKLMH